MKFWGGNSTIKQITYPTSKRRTLKQGFQEGYPYRNNWSHGHGNDRISGKTHQQQEISKVTNSGPFSQINTQKSLNCVNHTPTLKVLHQQMLINELDLTITSIFLAGRISHYAHNRELINQEWWILQTMASGANASALLSKTSPSIQCSVEKQGKIIHLSGFHV